MARKNKEDDKIYWKKWYRLNKERLKEKAKERYDKEENTEYMRNWRENNREKYNAYMREYYKRKKDVNERKLNSIDKKQQV